jgi:hypothetical protein
MSKLLVGLVSATILIACSAIGWKAQAAMVTGVENRLLTNSQPLERRSFAPVDPSPGASFRNDAQMKMPRTVLKGWDLLDIVALAFALVSLAALAYFAFQIIG